MASERDRRTSERERRRDTTAAISRASVLLDVVHRDMEKLERRMDHRVVTRLRQGVISVVAFMLLIALSLGVGMYAINDAASRDRVVLSESVGRTCSEVQELERIIVAIILDFTEEIEDPEQTALMNQAVQILKNQTCEVST